MKTFLKQTYSQQLAATFRQLIESGQWPVGMKVPPIRDVASQFDVGVSTAYQALRDLEEAGLIHRPVSGGLAYVNGEAVGQPAEEQPTSAPKRRAARRISHIALIGTAVATNPGRDLDDWNNRIVTATSDAVMNQSERYYLTRIGSNLPNYEKCFEDLVTQVQSLASEIAGAVVLAANSPLNEQIFAELDRLDIPWVSVNRPSESMTHNFVSANNIAGGRTIGRCFTLMDLRRVLVLSPDLSRAISWTQKVTGMVEAFMHHQHPTNGIDYVCVKGTHFPRDGKLVTLEYIEKHGPPQAIFATGDGLALGAIEACLERKLSVPGDVVVAGSTGLDAAAYARPSLSLIAQPMEAMGKRAVDMLVQMIKSGTRRCPGQEIQGELVIRQSMPISQAIRKTLEAEGYLLHAGDA